MSPYRVIDNTRSCLCNPCWAAKCACGKWLTKHAFSAEDAGRDATWVLERELQGGYHFAHICRTMPKSSQLQLELG